jgi:phosphate/sulfate permease
LISAGAYSLGHGTNDAQKTMGIIAALLVSAGKKDWTVGYFHFLGLKHELAMWIILSCHAAMAIGMMLGGWRIVKTMGSRITPHLRPIGGFSAELAAATTIGLATLASVPISTTHAIGGAVAGVGATRGLACGEMDLGTANRLRMGLDVPRRSAHWRTRLLDRPLRNCPICGFLKLFGAYALAFYAHSAIVLNRCRNLFYS